MARPRVRRLTVWAPACGLGLILLSGPFPVPPRAEAAFPGANGKIAFESDRPGNLDVYAMNPDGSGQTNLTVNMAIDDGAAWSPDGTKIAFYTDRDGDNEVFVMNADGSGQVNLTNNGGDDVRPAWSPDGTKIAFQTDREGNFDVFVMNADGSAPTNLTGTPAFDGRPSWSPDGTKIAFETNRDGNEEVYVMNADGSGQTNITSNAADDRFPDWQRIKLAKTVALKAKPKTAEEGQKARLKAKVTPCPETEGELVKFYRKRKRIGKKKTNASCVAVLNVVMKRTTKFRAVSPEQDFDYLAGTSRPVKVKVLEG